MQIILWVISYQPQPHPTGGKQVKRDYVVVRIIIMEIILWIISYISTLTPSPRQSYSSNDYLHGDYPMDHQLSTQPLGENKWKEPVLW